VAWIVGTVQNISLEEGAPERPGFFIQEGSSPTLALVFEDVNTAHEMRVRNETDLRQGGRHQRSSLRAASAYIAPGSSSVRRVAVPPVSGMRITKRTCGRILSCKCGPC
jgi:hypothetical protein